MIGLSFIMLALIIPFTPYNISYILDEPAIEGVQPVIVVTCPPPASQPSCDDYASEIKQAAGEDCDQIAGAKWVWFAVLVSCLVIGTIGGYVMLGFSNGSKSGPGG